MSLETLAGGKEDLALGISKVETILVMATSHLRFGMNDDLLLLTFQ